MPPSKPSFSTSAPVGSATVNAPPLISKKKAAYLAASKAPTLLGTPILCASVNAIVRSATQAQRSVIARSGTTRRKDHRRSAKSPPPAPLNVYLSFPSPSMATDPSPSDALGLGASTEADGTQHAAAPRPPRAHNDLRNRLDKRRSSPAGTAPAPDRVPPSIAPEPPRAYRDPDLASSPSDVGAS